MWRRSITWASSTWRSDGPSRPPQDNSIAFQLALAYFAQQQYDRAEPLFERVFKADPTIDGLGYYVGFIRYRKKDYRGALEAFRRGRTTDPQLQQLTKFYTGLSLAVLGLPAQASAEVEQALKLAPGSPLTGFLSAPTDQLAVPGMLAGAEITPEGDLYSGTAVRFSKARVTALGFFDGVEINQKRGSTDDKMLLEVTVKEKLTGAGWDAQMTLYDVMTRQGPIQFSSWFRGHRELLSLIVSGAKLSGGARA